LKKFISLYAAVEISSSSFATNVTPFGANILLDDLGGTGAKNANYLMKKSDVFQTLQTSSRKLMRESVKKHNKIIRKMHCKVLPEETAQNHSKHIFFDLETFVLKLQSTKNLFLQCT